MADFDWDKEAVSESAFDWDKEATPSETEPLPIVQPAPAKRKPIGLWRAMAVKGAEGATKGWSDELGRAVGSALIPDPVRATGQKDEQLTGGQVVQAAMRGEQRQAQKEHPYASFAAQALGDIGSDVLLSRLGVPGVGSLPYQLGMGALAGAGMSEEKSTGGVLGDATLGAGAALVGHGAGRYVLGPLAAKSAPMLKRALKDFALQQGRRVLLSGADQLSSGKKVAEEAVREAIESGAIKPLGSTEGAFERLRKLAEEQGVGYASIIEELEKQGVKGPGVAELAQRLRVAGAKTGLPEMNPAVQREFEDAAAQLEQKFPTGGAWSGDVKRVPLTVAEAIKRSLQKEANYERLKASPLEKAKRAVASIVREANEDAIEAAGKAAPEASDVRALAEGFAPVKQRLGRLIEARDAAERGVRAASRRRGGGLGEAVSLGLEVTGGPGAGAAFSLRKLLGSGRIKSAEAVAAHRLAQSRALANALASAPNWMGSSAPALIRAAPGVGDEEPTDEELMQMARIEAMRRSVR